MKKKFSEETELLKGLMWVTWHLFVCNFIFGSKRLPAIIDLLTGQVCHRATTSDGIRWLPLEMLSPLVNLFGYSEFQQTSTECEEDHQLNKAPLPPGFQLDSTGKAGSAGTSSTGSAEDVRAQEPPNPATTSSPMIHPP